MRKWETSFSLSPDAGKRFARFTESHIGDRLAVVLDNQIVSVATIESRIEDSGRITNLGSEDEAVDLSRYLRSGSLPAGVVYLEERSVGPSLGADSIHAGIVAGLAGLTAVIIAMLVYYKRVGVNAVLALLLNTIVLLAALSYFRATLTLPGIAGVILTIGMAVDSNVLIFERIREELRGGKGHRLGGRRGIRQGLVDDRGYTRDHRGLLRVPVHFRQRTGQGLRGDSGDRPDCERFHRGIRLQGNLRLRTVRPTPVDGVKYLTSGAPGVKLRVPKGTMGTNSKNTVSKLSGHRHGTVRWKYLRTRILIFSARSGPSSLPRWC